jgi:hypothetical protein
VTPRDSMGRPMRSYPYDRDQLTEEDVRRIARAEARALLTSVEARNVYPPRSIPLRTVDLIPVVTALPANPVDGDEVYFDTGLGFFWHFRYRAGAESLYPWESVGHQTPMYDFVTSQESTTSTTPTDLATAGPSLTPPLSGDYRLRFGASIQIQAAVPGTVAMAPSIGGSTPTEPDGCSVFVNQADTLQADCSTERGYTGWAAGAAVTLKYWNSFGTATGFYRGRFLAMYPVRVRRA